MSFFGPGTWITAGEFHGGGMLAEEMESIMADVLEIGFIASESVRLDELCAIVFLPITQADRTVAVMLVGYRATEPLPRGLLKIYPAIAGLPGAEISKLTAEKSLREEHDRLEELARSASVNR